MAYSPLPTDPFRAAEADQQQDSNPLNGMFRTGSFEVPRFRVAGNAPVFIHWSVVIILAFFGFLCWQMSGGLGLALQIFFTLLSPVFFLFSIFLHELGHAYMWHRGFGVWVRGIYLYAMGGLTTAAPDAGHNARKWMQVLVAVAGPGVNLLLGGALLGVYYGLREGGVAMDSVVALALWFHGWSQIFLAAYNMLPGVPLDGSNALVGLIRFCTSDGKAKLVGYAIGTAVLVAAIVLCFIFLGASTAIFIMLSLVYTAFALYDAYQREKPPESLTNPRY